SVENFLIQNFKQSKNSQNSLYLVNNLIVENSTKHELSHHSNLHIYLQKMNIAHQYFNSISMAELVKLLPQSSGFSSKEIFVVFDFASNSAGKITQVKFEKIAQMLSKIYSSCITCK